MNDKLAVVLYINQEYDNKKKQYERAIVAVKTEIEEYFADINVECIHYIKSRIKTRESMIEKVERKNYTDPFEQMKDIAGIRIVCHNESDVDQVDAFIKSRYKDSIIEDEKIKRDDGYRAHHIVVNVRVLFIGQPKLAKVEIQLRTVAQDLFDTLSRRDVYKLSTPLPETWLSKMKQLGDKLEEADKLAEELKQEWIEENIKTKAKDQLNAQAIIRICKKYSGEEVNVYNAMNCLANLVRHRITKISELENILEDKQTMEEIDKIYLELLERKADINGKIIYGSLLYKYGKIKEEWKSLFIQIIYDSIKSSNEFVSKMHKGMPILGFTPNIEKM